MTETVRYHTRHHAPDAYIDAPAAVFGVCDVAFLVFLCVSSALHVLYPSRLILMPQILQTCSTHK